MVWSSVVLKHGRGLLLCLCSRHCRQETVWSRLAPADTASRRVCEGPQHRRALK